MTDKATNKRTFTSKRRWLGLGGLAVGVCLALYILILSNIIAFRHPMRFDLTQEGLHTLSPQTQDLLELVQEPIRAVIPTYLQRDNPRHMAEREVLQRSLGLLREFVAKQPLIRIEAEVDVLVQSDRWVELRDHFGLGETELNRFVFFAGEENQFRQSVTPRDLASFGAVTDPNVEVPPITDFRGEEVLAAAITRLVERDRRPIYFTQGKQEPSLKALTADSAGRPDRAGLHVLRRELVNAGYDPRELMLNLVQDIPEECELLVIASPFQAYTEQELEKLDRFLRRGGHLFVALGQTVTGLENLLEEWGVGVKPGQILMRREAVQGWGETAEISVRQVHGRHPVTKGFVETQARFQAILFRARALEPRGGTKRLTATKLMATFSRGAEETYLRIRSGRQREILEQADFTLGVAVEQVPPQTSLPPGYEKLDTRLVVVGAGNFLNDSSFHLGSHRDFFLNSVAWLLGDRKILRPNTRKWEARTLDMSGDFRVYLKWVPTIVFPGIFLCLGLFVYYLRRV